MAPAGTWSIPAAPGGCATSGSPRRTRTCTSAGIPQDWLRELAKRHARWQLTAGLSSGEVTAGARAVTRLGVFLGSAGITSPAAVSREVLERFLASLTGLTATHRYKVISQISMFLQAVRLHGWEETLPAGAMIFREDYPRKPARLPRALAEHIMAQVEDPANLAPLR